MPSGQPRKRLNRREFVDETTPIEDDHLEFLAAPASRRVDIIDLDYRTDRLAHAGRHARARRRREACRPSVTC